jgi:nucleoid DNA-binding protein
MEVSLDRSDDPARVAAPAIYCLIIGNFALKRVRARWQVHVDQRRLLLAQSRNTKTATKKITSKPSAQAGRPIKDTLTKSALINLISDQNDIPRDTAKGVLATIEDALLGSVHPRGAGEFTLPGLLKVTLRKVPARKAGTMIRNPATGEMMAGAAKPASVRVKIRALSKLKTAALS